MEAPIILEKYMCLIRSPLIPWGDKCHPIELDFEGGD